MCEDFSGIITEQGKVLWLKENTADHQAIISEYSLNESEDSYKWVRFEINYKDLSKISREREDAVFKWDCKTLPLWAEKDAVLLIAQAWKAWDASRKTAVILEGETVAEVKDYYVAFCRGKIEYVYGNAKIESVYGNAQIKSVYENAQIENIANFATAIKNNVLYIAKDCKVKRTGKIGKK